MKKIGIIGNGFVGGAIAYGFSPSTTGNCKIYIYDLDPLKTMNTLKETVENSEFLFICVPTPMDLDGKQDLSILHKAFDDILSIKVKNTPIILLKSTVLPGTCEKLKKKYNNLKLVFNPEFLTERSARLDFINQSRIVLGGDNKDYINKVSELYKDRFKNTNIIKTDFKTAELIKYMCNVFFATKVSFANEMYQICNKIGANWDELLSGFVADGRIGDSHLKIPGPDGKLGFGGTCFPKDINALIKFSKDLKINIPTIKGAWKTNLKVRPERDWEKLEGRAVVKKEDSKDTYNKEFKKWLDQDPLSTDAKFNFDEYV